MKCRECGKDKPEVEFSWKTKAKGVRHTICKPCMVAYVDQRGAANRELLIEYLRSHTCVDCGEKDIDVLEFDHIEDYGPGNRMVWGWIRGSTRRMMEEVARCEVRCANCHTRKTRKQFGYLSR